MSAAALLTAQARNNAWANETLYAAILSLPAGAFAAPRPGFFGSIQATMNHIHLVDLYYLDALAGGGRGRAIFDQAEEADPARLARLQAATDLRLIAFCEGLSEGDLSTLRPTPRAEGLVEERVDRLLLHLFQHQVHHRGQAHGMLSHAGLAPPQLDDFYLDYGRVPSATRHWKTKAHA